MRAMNWGGAIGAVALTLCASLAMPASASADVRMTLTNGRVSIVAKDATIGQILAEWAKIGQTKIVNAEKIPGERVTIELTDTTEAQALDILLRKLTGYVVAARTVLVPDASAFDRIIIVPAAVGPIMQASAAPRADTASAAPAYQPAATPGYPAHEEMAPPAANAAPEDVAEVAEEPAPQAVIVGATPVNERAPNPAVRRQALETVDPRQFKLPPKSTSAPPPPPATAPPVGVARPGMVAQPATRRPPAPGQPPVIH
jgi:hypothetical protein